MAKRTRHRDKHSMGRGFVFRFVNNWEKRHERRLKTALDTAAAMEQWCKLRRIGLEISNEGQHWRFYIAMSLVAEWWPATAKFVVYQRYREAIHVQDWIQARCLLEVLLEHELPDGGDVQDAPATDAERKDAAEDAED